MEHRKGELNESCEGRGLVIVPLVVLDPVFEFRVVILAIADVEYEIVVGVLIVEVVSNVRDAISVDFLKNGAGREGHRDDAFGYVS
jgi:hypothetical protein